ncbi:MAG: phosphonate metabolism protein/1,5-bisphosphokinase (PRPP-forming) PhnN [Roseomonas sp.]|nr:phosphonate metabolism protein/1,5-bisphosphokinase (PRPP-forming) PhnN [Roseomonas sp.]
MLIAVVGPSGAGKDTLMAATRAALTQDSRFRFVRRAITRPADAGGEDHEALTEAAFAERRAAGGFALAWEAHGLRYGIPRDIEADMATRRVVIANLSRAALPEAGARYRLRVLNITAPIELLAARLAMRGRESAADIAARLAREVALPDGLDIERVINDADVAEGVARVLAVLNRAASDAQGS